MAKRVIVGNTTATPNPLPDWKQSDSSKADYIKNKPELADVASSGSFNDLINVPDFILASEKGAASGVASLDSNGKVLPEQLPFNLDGIIEGTYDAENDEFINVDGEVVEPEINKLYSDVDSGKSYRWGGTSYVEIVNSLALGTTSNTAYRGDYGHVAYMHSQERSGNPHNVSYDELVNKPFTTDAIDYILSVFGTNGSRGLKYDIYDDYAVCTGISEGYTDTEIEIASAVKGIPVTEIGHDAFFGHTNITNIIIPNSITSIGESAFGSCTSLKNIIIPDSVTNIGYEAFYNCQSFTDITIPSSVISVGDGAFARCDSLVSVNINYGITSISCEMFIGCTQLANINIPTSVTTIESCAFEECTSITDFLIPDSVTSIGHYAFCNCTNLKYVNVGAGVTYIGHNAFHNCNQVETMILPFAGGSANESTYLGYIFGAPDEMQNETYVPSNLKNVVVTQSVGDYAFNCCTNLTSVTILPGVTSIGANAFHACSALSSVIIPNTITNIGTQAFYGCISLVDVSIPDSVTSIGNLAFSNCLSLTNVMIPNSVTNIGAKAFQGCSQITYVYYMGTREQWDSIIVGANNQDLYNENVICYYSETIPMFEGRYWYYDGDTPTLWPAFSTTLTYTLNDDGTAYTVTDDNNCTDTEIVIMPIYNELPVTSIDEDVFSGRTDIISVIIPDNISIIGNSAFADCTNLKSVTVGNGISKIGNSAFNNCTAEVHINDLAAWCMIEFTNGRANPLYSGHKLYLKGEELIDLTIPDNISSIRKNAFIGCHSLQSVTMGDDVQYIDDSAFSGCPYLIDFAMGNNVNSLGASVFSNCAKLKNLTIPQSVTSIGSYAFRNCTGMTNINYDGTKAQWGLISRGNDWDIGASQYLICCTDGIICKTHTPADAVREDEIAPTCTEGGSYKSVVRCSVCGQRLRTTTELIPQLSHTPMEAVMEDVVQPTCTTAGRYYSTVYCSECGRLVSRNLVTTPSLGGHSYDSNTGQCGVCGIKQEA